MRVELDMATPGAPELAALLDAAAWACARWVLTQGDAAPCCVDCSGIRYVPDKLAAELKLATGGALQRRGTGSCGELAALAAGIRRARALRDGRTVAEASREAWVEPQPRRRTDRGTVWHAVTRYADGTTYDPEQPTHG